MKNKSIPVVVKTYELRNKTQIPKCMAMKSKKFALKVKKIKKSVKSMRATMQRRIVKNLALKNSK
jgi:hypothetical protein